MRRVAAAGWIGMLWVFCAGGCTPSPRLTFPLAPLADSGDVITYDTNGNGKADFGLLKEGGRVVALTYDDDEDGRWARTYRLADYAQEHVPHLIVMFFAEPGLLDGLVQRVAGSAWSEAPKGSRSLSL